MVNLKLVFLVVIGETAVVSFVEVIIVRRVETYGRIGSWETICVRSFRIGT